MLRETDSAGANVEENVYTLYTDVQTLGEHMLAKGARTRREYLRLAVIGERSR